MSFSSSFGGPSCFSLVSILDPVSETTMAITYNGTNLLLNGEVVSSDSTQNAADAETETTTTTTSTTTGTFTTSVSTPLLNTGTGSSLQILAGSSTTNTQINMTNSMITMTAPSGCFLPIYTCLSGSPFGNIGSVTTGSPSTSMSPPSPGMYIVSLQFNLTSTASTLTALYSDIWFVTVGENTFPNSNGLLVYNIVAPSSSGGTSSRYGNYYYGFNNNAYLGLIVSTEPSSNVAFYNAGSADCYNLTLYMTRIC